MADKSLIERIYSSQMDEKVRPGKVLILYGPRQVGKTTLVRQYLKGFNGRYYATTGEDLHTIQVLTSFSQDEIRRQYGDLDLLFIDEAQVIPQVGHTLKFLVDTLPDLKVVVTGSSSFELANQTGEPLVGRKTTLTLYPFSFDELRRDRGFAAAEAELDAALVYGSYPEVWLARSNRGKMDVLRELAESYLYKDILAFESIKNSAKIRQLLSLLAFQVGKEVSLTELGTRLSLARQTVERYLDLLEKCFVVYRVGGFARNLRNEITKTSRWYFFDNGVMNCVSGQLNDLSMRADVGALWENWVMAERLKRLTYEGRFPQRYFWRTYVQSEIDCVEEENGQLAAWEFKAGDKMAKVPQSWKAAYPQSTWNVVNRTNFETFICNLEGGEHEYSQKRD